jgi:membrane-associated protease RseP (regulator of RpoE activity)
MTQSNFIEYDLQPLLAGLIAPANIRRAENGTIIVRGKLLRDADQAYRPLRARFERLGYTPFLRAVEDGVELVAAPGVVEPQRTRWATHIGLFIATIITVVITGAITELQVNDLGILWRQPALLLAGVPFAATLIGILFAHEMGHYIVARLRGAPASPPYFIPMLPGLSFTGTMGAVIVQREPFENRRMLLEVAIAGPLAGLAVALPLLFYGLSTSEVSQSIPPYLREGNSVLYALTKFAVFGQWLPADGIDVRLNTVAWAAWIGLLVTMLNLLPIGQLDGGHIAYALFGRGADMIAYTMIAVCLALGLLIPNNLTWLVWVALVALMGPRHPAPLNDVTQLSPRYVALGVVGLVTFLVLFMPAPMQAVMG